MDVLSQDLRVMDASAISLMRDNAIPIIVFSIRKRGAFLNVLTGDGVHTVIANDGPAR
jgi:uridylate kinase